ncbi:MAG TPA: 2Fe-2S iron-sulfur cluster-binding protein [Saprospiraceae bacterium]|nr:2Fe-2S iron-sulfur cluster-binding protein [Saprospiraceae bacterium]
MAKVHFLFEDKTIENQTIEGDFQNQSLLELTEEFDIHLNHNCGGVCACSTCHVYIHKGDKHIEEISDKEEDFIDRAINPRLESRLACQCIILDQNCEITVEIPDQKRIIGHEH